MSVSCPECQGNVIVDGRIYNQVDYINPPAYFMPNGYTYFSALKKTVPIVNNFSVCSFCGFIWSKIRDKDLHNLKMKTSL